LRPDVGCLEGIDDVRLATVFDTDFNEPRPVFELPGGERIELRELFRAPGGAAAIETLREMPLYFTDLVRTVQHLDDVVAAVRAWATQRSEAATHPLGQTTGSRMNRMAFCAPIPAPRSFRSFDAFEQHAATSRNRRGASLSSAWYDEPRFCFANAGALLGHEAPVHAPDNSHELDFELQLGVIIGIGGRDIATSDAWKHVAGFTIVNSFGARDLERAELPAGLGPAKGKDFACAVGPYLITLEALRDRIDSQGRVHLNMTARVNGRELSRGDAAMMHFTWPQIIEHASRDAELFAGDIISSGAVGGGCILDLGPENTGGWLKPGDVVELEIERLGVLRTPIIARPDAMRRRTESLGAATATA
jgi:fumarylacetoacetate (FAA) hydrolase